MANVPKNLLYSKDHEWVRVEGGSAVFGITDHAQKQLGDVVYIELPKVGDQFEAQEPFGSVESVKAVSELFMPVGGTIEAVNGDALSDEPETVNTDPYGDGWMIKVKMRDAGETKQLLSAAEYEKYIAEAE